MIDAAPIVREVVLLGGGHSHVLLIRRWAMKPVPGVRLILVSENVLTPYSGMLPGFVAGHYSLEDIHIDLSRLCRWAGVRFIEQRARGIDPERQQILFEGRPAIEYDVLSVDTGSTPELDSVPGAREHVVPVKPIGQFREHWQSLLARHGDNASVVNIGVVGSGVGGFELLLAMHHALAGSAGSSSAPSGSFRFHWVIRGKQPLRNRPESAREKALAVCAEKNIQVHTVFDVVEVFEGGVKAASSAELALDEIVWSTAAAAPAWIAESGLATDARGFIATNKFLQSSSHANVFASGDVGTQVATPCEKAGVFAVRQAPVLTVNLRNFLLNRPLKPYVPQKNILNLMALGHRSAIATRGNFTVSGDWVWRWKDYIDRKFMNRFSDLKVRQMPAVSVLDIPDQLLSGDTDIKKDTVMRCGGCGAKVPASVLETVLAKLEPISHKSILTGYSDADDAAVIAPVGPLVQSVDQFRSMLEDPWLFGRIATLHALSDLFAMGSSPHSAQMLVGLPYAADKIHLRELYQLMSGAIVELNRHNCALIGGHSSESSELTLGLSVNGTLGGATLSTLKDHTQSTVQSNLVAGDVLILSKPLGTGVLLAADMNGEARGLDMHSCIESMLLSNEKAASVFLDHGVSAMTDITGFGLIGHLLTLLRSSTLHAEISLGAIPVLDGALSLAEAGTASSLFPANRVFLDEVSNVNDRADAGREIPGMIALMVDPQTSGGLLAGVKAENAQACCDALIRSGHSGCAIIGTCREPTASSQSIHLI